MSTGRQIRLTENPDGWGTATDVDTGAVSQGETREAALANLSKVVAGIRGEGNEPTDEELRDLGVDPERDRNQGDELPDVLK